MSSYKTILSLCDYTGNWSKPYVEDGYNVICLDLKHGQDIRLSEYSDERIHGILAAPPCTAFAGSGAQYWSRKDESGETLEGLSIVDACLRAVVIYKPQFWALENPVGRLRRYLGPPSFAFNPCDFGDAYTKKTYLWGSFVPPLPLFVSQRPVEPEYCIASNGDRYAPYHFKSGGRSEKTKEIRSATPMGFARAFFEANR